MKTNPRLKQYFFNTLVLATAVFSFSGCQCPKKQSDSKPAVAAASVAPAVATPAAKQTLPTIRIRAGSSEKFTDASGNVWLAAQGFADGDTVDRSELTIANTKDQTIYRSERYSMSAFTQPLPNGKYTVKLHFAETYEGISGAGQRVFSFNVEGREFKDFDVWAKAGGGLLAYVETVNVEINDGKLDIAFTSNVENPEINGIEILPGS
jgi:hypothetical protein